MRIARLTKRSALVVTAIALLIGVACRDGGAEPSVAEATATAAAVATIDATPATDITPDITRTPPPASIERGPVLTVRYRGGLCPHGLCQTTVYVSDDGSYLVADGDGSQRDGTVSNDAIEALSIAIARANFDALRSERFTDVCPTAYDGQEVIYTFLERGNDETLSSCEWVIDDRAELFARAAAVLAEIGR